MRKIRVEEAVGKVLCHDITRIVPGEFKGPAFRKGHVIRPEDVNQLLELGKDHGLPRVRLSALSLWKIKTIVLPYSGKVYFYQIRVYLLLRN